MYSSYGIGLDSRSELSLTDESVGKNGIISGVNISLSVHIDNKGKYILILGKGPTQELDDTTLTAEAQCSVNFSRSNRRFYLSLRYNGSNSLLFVNATKIYQFRAKDSEIKNHRLCLGNVSGNLSASNMKKTGLNGCVYSFFVHYRTFGTSNIIAIHKYLMKKHDIE